MTKHYFVCEWVVRAVVVSVVLKAVEDRLGCKPIFVGIGETETGLHIMKLAVEVGSPEVVQGLDMPEGFEVWKPIEYETYSKGISVIDVLFPPDSTPSAFDAFIRHSWFNEVHLDRLKYKDQSNFYFACKWIAEASRVDYVIDTYNQAMALECSFYKLRPVYWVEQKEFIDVFGVRSATKEIFEEFVATIPVEAGLNDWQPISEDEFYDGAYKFTDTYTVQDGMDFYRK